MEKYLYGASVQGIQQFVFRTNKLKSIIGASELVARICTDEFTDLLGRTGDDAWIKEHRVVSAAGNIKYILDEQDCREVVREFPKMAMMLAPGITISQAVVRYEESCSFSGLVDSLESRLKAERNRPASPLLVGQLGVKRSLRTGEPMLNGVAPSELVNDYASNSISALCTKSFGFGVRSRQIAFDVGELTSKNDWIAIVHVDGNSMGQVVQKIGRDRYKFADFSERLDLVTNLSANDAYNSVKGHFEDDGIIPIRPVVLGGDDMTVIIRAELAVEYTEAYMRAFEKHSKSELGRYLAGVFDGRETHLTSCGGIAFVKSSYPFYYAYDLAEQLCSESKRVARANRSSENALMSSCLMFHKVQDSFIRDYSDIENRELTAGTVSFKHGPYFLNEEPNLNELTDCAKSLDMEEAEGVRSGLREYLSLLHENPNKAKQRLERLKSENRGQIGIINALSSGNNSIMAYDCLALHTILTQNTKDNK